jgi:hypothetical protein
MTHSEDASAGADAPDSPIDFTTFVLSLSSTAMIHLGAIPDPDTGKPSPNFSLAQQTLDILLMLRAKTQGNLNSDEARALDDVIARSQRCMEVARRTGVAPCG